MQKDNAGIRERAEGWQMGFCMDNCKIRNLRRNNSNHFPTLKGFQLSAIPKLRDFIVSVCLSPSCSYCSRRTRQKLGVLRKNIKGRKQSPAQTYSHGSLMPAISCTISTSLRVVIGWEMAKQSQLKWSVGKRSCFGETNVQRLGFIKS